MGQICSFKSIYMSGTVGSLCGKSCGEVYDSIILKLMYCWDSMSVLFLVVLRFVFWILDWMSAKVVDQFLVYIMYGLFLLGKKVVLLLSLKRLLIFVG